MGVPQNTSIVIFTLLITISQTYATTALLAAASNNNNCSYALYSRTKTFTHKSTTAVLDNRTCEWRITVSENEKILLNLTEIVIYKTPNCTQGYLEVRDGYWYTSSLLGRFCGGGDSSQILYRTVLSTSNKLLISYTSSRGLIGEGFVASYEGICGGSLFVENQTTISSPNYPSPYPLNKKCVWRIVVPDGKTVALSFNFFSVEYESNCLYDYVEVREGASLNGRIIGRYCNANRPPSVLTANSSEIFVTFVSDSSLALQGFEAVVTQDADECALNMHGCAQLCVNLLHSYKCACYPGWQLHSNGQWCEVACGGNLNSATGRITSPSYPYVYPLNRSCKWNIKTFYEAKITINFEQFSLENGFSNGTVFQCTKDWLKVSHSERENPWTTPSTSCQSNTSSEVVKYEGTYCGVTTIAPITSSGNQLSLSFNSDATIQRNGFVINYSTELEGCLINNGNCHHACVNNSGSTRCECTNNFTLQDNRRDCTDGDCLFEISSPFGIINSPNYPNAYPNNKKCEWKFKTTPGHRFNITFHAFQLENNPNYDSVILYDGPSNASSVIGTFYGSVIPNQLNSSTNELYVTFKTDGSAAYTGFQASYSTVCGGLLTANSTEKYIYSHPNFGYEEYANGVFCEWTITAPPGKTVTVAFLSFLLESGACTYDYVDILNKSGSITSTLGRYCGDNKPPRICSTSNALVVRFRTDGSVTNKGFSMVYKTTD